MKKLNLFVISFLLSHITFSQTLFVPGGAAGIGNSTTGSIGVGVANPTDKLEVAGAIKVVNAPSSSWRLVTNADGSFSIKQTGFVGAINISQSGISNTNLLNLMDRKVGIGTTSPQGNLHISSGNDGDAVFILSADENNSNESNNPLIQLRQDGRRLGMNIGFSELDFGQNTFGIGRRISNVNYWDTFVIDVATGNIGMGTNNTASYKLSVNGNIRAKEIKVETGWSDFVFEEDYDLPTLEEVEKHIKEKGHLPEIPSAKEVEENGVELGKMDSKLLQKIEELTLYVIEQNKEIKALQHKNKALEEKINTLEK